MPYEVSFEDKGAYARFEGRCGYNDILQATIQIWENPKFEYMRYEIFDYLNVSEFSVSEEDVIEIAVRDNVASRSTRREKIAVLATLAPILDLTDRYRKTIEGSDISLFITDNLPAARSWIESDGS